MIKHEVARILRALANRIEPDSGLVTDEYLERLSNLIGGHVGGYGVAGRNFTPQSFKTYTY